MTKATSNAVIAAFTEEQVERLAGVSQRQLRYWANDKFFVPSLAFEEEDMPVLRMYSFRDLVCLKVINALRNDAKIPLGHLREVKDKLSHLGDDLWAKTTLYVLGKKVVFDNPETGEKEEVASGQGVLQIPLLVVSGNMEEAVKTMRQRNAASIGKIEKKRGVSHSKPVISGTRIPVKSVQAFSEAGYSIDEIMKQYPTLTREDIRAAINYKAVA